MNLQKESKKQDLTTKNYKKSLLVVEDEKFWVELLKLELCAVQPDIEIVHAQNGEEAVQYIKMSQENIKGENGTASQGKGKYDAIITDIQMPVMDGCTAVRIIRDLLYTGPILVWSAYRDSSEDLKKALDIPVSGFCVKEGSLQNLLMHLKNLKVIE